MHFSAFRRALRLFLALLASVVAGNSATASEYYSTDEQGNSVSIKQVGTGNRSSVRQSSGKDADALEKKLVEQNYKDKDGNQAIIVQQGPNIATERDRVNNLVSQQSAITAAAAARVAPAAGTPAPANR